MSVGLMADDDDADERQNVDHPLNIKSSTVV
jgi:hypothetical protein